MSHCFEICHYQQNVPQHYYLLDTLVKSVNVNLKCIFINHDINYLSRKLKYKQTFAIVCSFTVSVNELRATDSSTPQTDFPLMNKVDRNLSFVGSGNSYGSFLPIPNNILPDKD